MKKALVFVLCAAILFASAAFAGKVSDKVDKMMSTDQQRYEKTYYPRDMMSSQISIKLGYPLVAGVGFSKNINEMFAIGIGAGSSLPGIAADLNFTYYILPTSFTPYVTVGAVCYGLTEKPLFTVGAEVAGGIDYVFDGGFGVNIGACWVKTFDSAASPFATYVGDSTDINKLGLTAGLNMRF